MQIRAEFNMDAYMDASRFGKRCVISAREDAAAVLYPAC